MQEVLFAGFGRKEEDESDAKGLALATKAGYAPGGLATFLQKLADRNKGSDEKRGLFASHPDTLARIKILGDLAKKATTTATLEARFKKHISYKPVPQSEMAQVPQGASGLASGGGKKADPKKDDTKEAKAEEPKKKGFGLSRLASIGGGDKTAKETSGSQGARGLDKERYATGGGNPTVVAVNVTGADVAAFKKEGKLS
jgi:hypothetical protein